MSVQPETSPQAAKKGLLSNLLRGGKTYWIAALLVAFIAIAGSLTILGRAAATTTFFVLGQPVAARTPITPEMLVPVTTSLGGQPRNAFDDVFVRDNPVFAKVPLNAGDIVSASNAGPLERISAGLPDDFVAASFQLAPENAVAGKVRKGDYIDVIAVDDSQEAGSTSKVVLHHVLVLDVTVSPQEIADAANDGVEGDDLNPGPESEAVRGGIPALYVVGVTPQDATKLALVRDSALMVTLSANSTDGQMDVQTQLGNVFAPEAVGDSGAGTEEAAAAAQAAAGTADPNAEVPVDPAAPAAPPATEAPADADADADVDVDASN